MTDQAASDRSVGVRPPAWFWAAAIAAILFEIVGVTGYLMDALRSPGQIAQLPLDQRLMWNATPTWVYIAYAAATFSGLLGTVALILRRRWCIPLLGLSLVAVVVQFGGVYAVPRLRKLVPPDAMVVPIVIFTICALIYALAHHAEKRGWLRA